VTAILRRTRGEANEYPDDLGYHPVVPRRLVVLPTDFVHDLLYIFAASSSEVLGWERGRPALESVLVAMALLILLSASTVIGYGAGGLLGIVLR